MVCGNAVAEHGFAIIPNVFADEEVKNLIENLNRLNLVRTRAGLRHGLKHPEIAALAQDPRLLHVASKLLNDRALPFRATVFDKSPTANWRVVWHQDTALPLRKRRNVPGWGPWSVKEGVVYAHASACALSKIVTLRLHLDDSTPHNGPLRVLPGTHTLGVLSDDEIHNLANCIAPFDCVVRRRGILAMRPLIVHSSSKSRVDAARRVLHLEYTASEFLAEGLELAIA